MAKYRLAAFSATKFEIVTEVTELAKPEDVKGYLGKYAVTWLDCVGLTEANIGALGEIFGFHRLCLEDCSQLPQRPKVDDYGDYFFLVIKEIEYSKGDVKAHQVSMFVGRNYVVTIREKPSNLLDPLFDRIAQKSPRLQDKGSDYLCYAIVDRVIDGYAPILEVVEDEIEAVESEILLDKVSKETLKRIFKMKRDLLLLRKIIIPTREMVLLFQRGDFPNMTDKARIYLRDVYDNIIAFQDLIDTHSEIVSSIVEAYLSTISNNINNVVKVLTVLATLGIMPTVISGIYGMNFDVPEYKWKWGYYYALGLMLVSTVAVLYYFKKKKWI